MNQQYYLLTSAIYSLSKGVLWGKRGGSPFSHVVKKCICFPFFYTEHTALCPYEEKQTNKKTQKIPKPPPNQSKKLTPKAPMKSDFNSLIIIQGIRDCKEKRLGGCVDKKSLKC